MDALIAQINAAFDARPRPSDDGITRCSYDKKYGGAFAGPCGECAEMGEYFKGKSWRELTGAELFREGQATSLFTITAYCYFLPAFLIAAIREPEEADVCVDHLAYQLGAKNDYEWGKTRAADIVAELSSAERAATLAYFRFDMARDGDFDGYCERAIDILSAEKD